MQSSRAVLGVALSALTLVLVQAVGAAETQPVKLNAADQAAAKAVTLRAADLGRGWQGGATKPDLTPDQTCATKRSDLLITGAAKSEFRTTGAYVSSESNVLRTAAMVNADWTRTVASTAFMACARRQLTQQQGASFVSFKKLPFPSVARYTARYRVVYDYGTAAVPAPVLIDLIFLGQGRSEISLMVSAPWANRAQVDGVGRRLATILVGRLRA